MPSPSQLAAEDELAGLCGCGHTIDAHGFYKFEMSYMEGYCTVHGCSCPGYESDNLQYLIDKERHDKQLPR